MIKNFIKILIAISILIFIIISRFKKIALTKSFLTFHVLFIINSTIIFCFLLITTLYLLLKNKEHFSDQGLELIAQIKDGMNTKR